ncbi:hypothetical protein B2J93_7227 [Marssonina coronariae]|uniref:Uncharacterized protein n=1 Tax=Diplocarpon coronariae TaxID=2795749 RepID=A0A218YS79_9HELO|nr:hypothetical protein B2J93_7227 [Marssonina coronariae]
MLHGGRGTRVLFLPSLASFSRIQGGLASQPKAGRSRPAPLTSATSATSATSGRPRPSPPVSAAEPARNAFVSTWVPRSRLEPCRRGTVEFGTHPVNQQALLRRRCTAAACVYRPVPGLIQPRVDRRAAEESRARGVWWGRWSARAHRTWPARRRDAIPATTRLPTQMPLARPRRRASGHEPVSTTSTRGAALLSMPRRPTGADTHAAPRMGRVVENAACPRARRRPGTGPSTCVSDHGPDVCAPLQHVVEGCVLPRGGLSSGHRIPRDG